MFNAFIRVFDIVFALAVLIITSPLVLVGIAAIRIETPGPALFRQQRMGRRGTTFSLVKLRGMHADAPERFPQLYEVCPAAGQNLALFYFHRNGDPRVTRVGRFLRKYSIDELPNFWNVLRGDMSIVGPRPEIPELAPLYGSHLATLLSIKPGITSPSKVGGRDRLSFEETLRLDLEYVRNRSFSLNARTIVRTAFNAFRGSGVR